MLDSSFLIAYHNQRDPHHARAYEAMRTVAEGGFGPALLPEYVALETLTVLASRRGLDKAVEAAEALLAAREFEFVPCSDVFLDAYARFKGQPSAKLSLADEAIVVIAERRGARHVATFDEDFRRVPGLKVVPGTRP